MSYSTLAKNDFEPTAIEIERDYQELLTVGDNGHDYRVIEDDDYWYY